MCYRYRRSFRGSGMRGDVEVESCATKMEVATVKSRLGRDFSKISNIDGLGLCSRLPRPGADDMLCYKLFGTTMFPTNINCMHIICNFNKMYPRNVHRDVSIVVRMETISARRFRSYLHSLSADSPATLSLMISIPNMAIEAL